jgi:hypothetical protein
MSDNTETGLIFTHKLLIPEQTHIPAAMMAWDAGGDFDLLANAGARPGYHCMVRLGELTYLACIVQDGILTGRPNPRALAATAHLGAAFALPGPVLIGGLTVDQIMEIVTIFGDVEKVS